MEEILICFSMKKFKLPKIKIKKFNTKGVFTYLISILISSIILALILIALPLSERVTSLASYDLTTKNRLYWAKEYTLQLTTENNPKIDQDIEKTKSILQKRLRTFGVEQSSIRSYEKEGEHFLDVSVQTSKSKELVDALVKSPFIVNILTRKDDVNYEDTENPLIPYLAENYNTTEFTRETFRNVYVTQLKNSAGEYSYFALFKTWTWEKDWDTFLNDYSGQTVGVSIDGFVTPVQVSADQNIFAVSVSSAEKESADVTSILYNSGILPLSYSTVTEEETVVESPEIDYIKLTAGILVAILAIYIYLLFIEKTPKNILVRSGVSTVITVAGWIAYLKISNTPVDIFLLALEIITIVAIIRIITENVESRIFITILLVLISLGCIILGSGYVKIFTNDLLILMILSNLSLLLTTYYVSNVRKSLKI